MVVMYLWLLINNILLQYWQVMVCCIMSLRLLRAGARQVFERWMEWEPEEQAWHSYINFELRYKELNRARVIYEKYILYVTMWCIHHACICCWIVTNYKSKSKKVKYVDLYIASSRSASNELLLPISLRWSPQADPTARHQRTLWDHVIRVGVSRDMPVYSPAPGTHCSLSRLMPGCLVPCRGGLPVEDGHPPRH